MSDNNNIVTTLVENPQSLAMVCGAAVLIAAFIAMAVPSNPSPPKTLAEVQADIIKTSQQNMINCINNAMNDVSSSERTSSGHEKVVAACTAAFSAVKDKLGDIPTQPNKS